MRIRRFILFVVVALSGCGGQASSLPTQSPTVSSPSVVAQIMPSPVSTPSLIPMIRSSPPSTVPTEESFIALIPPGVYVDLSESAVLSSTTGMYTLRFGLDSTYLGTVTSTVTVTLMAEGVIDALEPSRITLVVTPGMTFVTTTLRVKEEGQGRIIFTIESFTHANDANSMPCGQKSGRRTSLDFLATNIGIFLDSGAGMEVNYLLEARAKGVISEQVYQERRDILWTVNRGLIIELNGVEQEIHRLPPLPNPPIIHTTPRPDPAPCVP